MTGEAERRLSAALRAQAAGLSAGAPAGTGSARPDPEPTDHAAMTAITRPRLPAWAVLVLAVLLGATAGVLAGVISTW